MHSTRAMAERAVDLCVALLYEEPSAESVARLLRAHGERAVAEGEPAEDAGDSRAEVMPVEGVRAEGVRAEGVRAEGVRAEVARAEVVRADDVAAMREAAGRLVEVLAAPGTDAAAGLLNRILADTARPPRLTSHGGASPWHVHVDAHDDVPWAEWFLASSAMALAVLLADHQRVPGGLCASAGCRRPYLDLGGGSPRRFCGTRCATRERVAAHRARA